VDEPRLARTWLAAHGNDPSVPTRDTSEQLIHPTDLVIACDQWRKTAPGSRLPRAPPAGIVIESIEIADTDCIRSWFAVAHTEQPQRQFARLGVEQDLARERRDPE
jgi:hypothetical protein